MAGPIRVGIVGCGAATQIIHLPALIELRALFAVTALCDVSPSVLASVGAPFPGVRLFADYRQLVEDPAVDAVLVGNPDAYHADVVIAAIRAGKHVLLEKPIAVTLAETDAMIAAESHSAATVQVGYMRRYAPAFVEAVALAAEVRGDIVLARVHDVIGPNATIIDNSVHIVNNTNIVNVYKNARIANAVSGVDAAQFGRGNAHLIRVSDGQMRSVD